MRGKSRACFRSRIGGTTPSQFLYGDFVVRGWGRHSDSEIFQDICKHMKSELVGTGVDVSKLFLQHLPFEPLRFFDQPPPEPHFLPGWNQNI